MSLEILKDILETPTAPFRESAVIDRLLEHLHEAGVSTWIDASGNIIVGSSSEKDFLKKISQRTPSPMRVFIAHMDHPGFHGLKWKKAKSHKLLVAKWHGGAPMDGLLGANVWTSAGMGYAAAGKIVAARYKKNKNGSKALDTIDIQLTGSPLECTACLAIDPKELYGGFAFRAPVWQQGSRIYTKAADDLVGTYAIVEIARSLKGRPWMAILSRAEEVGFIGTIGHLERYADHYLQAKRPVLFVSLETSRTLPGAIIGKGPVVRLGDRWTVFSPKWTRMFSDLAQKVLPKKHQRRIMDGGSCEASAVSAYGLEAIGISVPLGNYHNQNLEGGPDARGGVGPESVDWNDVQGMVRLCGALVTTPIERQDPWIEGRRRFRKSLLHYQKLLRY